MATYYVSSTATGSDNGLSVGSPWTVTQLSAATLAPGSVVQFAAGAYNLTASATITGTSNGAADYLVRTDGGTVVLKATSAMAQVIKINNLTAAVVKGMVIDGNNLATHAVNGTYAYLLEGCEIKGAVQDGVSNGDNRYNLRRCYVHDNGRYGLNGSIKEVYGCTFKANTTADINSGVTGPTLLGCVLLSTSTTGGAALDTGLLANVFIGPRTITLGRYYGATTSGAIFVGPSVSLGYATTSYLDACYTSAASTSVAGLQALGFDPFVASASLDLRLTAQAKASAYAAQLRAVLAAVVIAAPPQVTLDSLADLFAGGGLVRGGGLSGGLQ